MNNAMPQAALSTILFYTQTKTITARWFEDGAVTGGVNTTISLK